MKELINCKVIEEYRKVNNLTVKEFCEQCKISKSTYYRIMQGKDFKLISLFRVAKLMKLKFYKLFL